MKDAVINTFVIIVLVLVGLAMLRLIDWSLVFMITGIILGFIFLCLTVYNFTKIMKTWQVGRIKRLHNKDFEAEIVGTTITGKVAIVKHNKVHYAYLCFNDKIKDVDHDYAIIDEKLGFKNAWFIGFADESSMKLSGVNNLKIY